jgi:putative transposase
MGRALRAVTGGMVFHVLNRGNARARIFHKDADYEAFERILADAKERYDMRVLAYCLMPNHWHLVLWPRHDGDLSRFIGWLTLTHTQRWHAHRGTGGTGHVYQGRFKSFPVQTDDHFLTVCRYVERNASRADLARRAEQWRWCSLWRRLSGDAESKKLLSEWPVRCPRDWKDWVNEPQTEQEVEAIRRSIVRGSPFGDEPWVDRIAKRLGLEITLRPRGRPRKSAKNA